MSLKPARAKKCLTADRRLRGQSRPTGEEREAARRLAEETFAKAVKRAMKCRGSYPELPLPPLLSPEEARESLVQLGIVTSTGRLTQLYR